MPIYDDWESAVLLITAIEQTFISTETILHFLLVDDEGSSAAPEHIKTVRSTTVVEILRLRRNLGHQRAIAIGLMHLLHTENITAVVVMDGDGEDTPEGIQILLHRFHTTGEQATIFAQRARRTEGYPFKVFYYLFRLCHRFLTGKDIRIGNFSILPRAHLACLAAAPELWNHFAAAVMKARLPTHQVPIDRGHRLVGQSRMNFTALLAHGFSAISVFADVVALRLLIASSLLAIGAASGLIVVTAIRLTTTLAIPGWATTAAGLLFVVLLQALLLSFVFVFIVLHGRNTIGFLPIRDYHFFIEGTRRIDRHD
ncbi:MAG: glycosyltransferase [Candidatus Binatia bacterium]